MRRVLALALVVFVIGSATVAGITSFAGIATAAANSATVSTTDVTAGTPVTVLVEDDSTTADPGYTAIASVDATYDGTDVGGTNATADATAVDIDTSGAETGDYTVYVANVTSPPADGTTLSAWANVTVDQTVHVDGSTGPNFPVVIDSTSGPVDAGDTLTVEATVENVGDLAGETPVELAVDGGATVDDETVSLDGGANETVVLSYDVPADNETGSLVANVSTQNDSVERTVSVNGNETLSGTLTDGATGDALSGVTVTVDDGEHERTVQTDANGEYQATVLNDREVTVSATTTVDGVEETVGITGSNATTVDGATTLDLELYPELPGSGTENDPYEISNARELQAMSQDLSGNYVLVDDVDASGTADWNDGKGFDPVGTTDDDFDPELSTVFQGSLDGKNHSITGLTINSSDEPYVGLFGAATNTNIENVSLTNIDVSPSFENVEKTFVYTGGLVGLSERLHISSVDASGSVSGEVNVGGLVGGSFVEETQKKLTMWDVTADVDVVFDAPLVADGGGSIVGFWSNPATIENVRSAGDVAGSGGSTGGFAGVLGNNKGTSSHLTNVSVSGNVSTDSVDGPKKAGGLIGEARDVRIVRSAATGNVYTNDNEGAGTTYAGGLIGGVTTEPVSITDSYVTGDVGALDGTTGADYAGGLVGDAASEINNSFASGAVEGKTVGGISAEFDSDMTNVYWNESTAGSADDSGSNDGATGLTPAQMTGVNATEHMDGLDYDTTWLAVEGESEYPVLGWQVAAYDLSLADDDIDVGNTTEATVAVTLDDGTQTTATTTSNYTASGNVSVDDGTVTADTYGPGSVNATAGGHTDAVEITALGSDFRVELRGPPASVNAGESNEFEATVANVGNDAGTKHVAFSFDGTEFADRSVTLDPGETTTVTVGYTIPADADTGTADLNATTPDDAVNATVQVNGYRTLSGTLTDGVSGETLPNVPITADGDVVATTNASGYYEATVYDGQTVTVAATTTVTDSVADPEITNETAVTIDGNKTADLTLWPELDGSGTESDPYRVGNVYELQAMNQDLDANYTLVSDVDASETSAWNESEGFDPVGEKNRAFNGTFRGSGHEISDLTVDDALHAGLFGTTGSGSDVANLTLTNATVNGDARYAGLAVGSNDGTVSSVHATGTVTDPDDTLGGLVGLSKGEIRNSSADVEVTGGRVTGGLVGANFLGNVTRSTSTGSVDSDVAGGLVGENGGTVNASYSTATVRGETAAGGLVGQNAISFIAPLNGTISGSYAAGLVDPDDNASDAGGLVGTNSVGSAAGTAVDSYWDSDVTGQATSDGGGTGLTTENTTGVNATGNMALDFETIWAPTTGYPAHRWNETRAEVVFAVTTIDAPAYVVANHTLTVEATVENVGAASGAKTVTLSSDGTRLATKSVTVAAGANETVSIEGVVPAGTAPGDYEVAVTSPAGGVANATVEVKTLRTLSGTVTDGVSGDALADETVTVQYASGRTETVQTDPSGFYAVEVFEGSNVTVSANVTTAAVDDPRINDSATLTVDSDETVTLELWPELDGKGTKASPYEISNAYELQTMEQDGLANYTLVSDVNASGTAAWNDGAGFDSLSLVGGTFDGNGHEIDNLTIDSDNRYTGLFGAVWGGSHISDLSLVNATANNSTASYTGLLAGSLTDSTVENVSVSGRVREQGGFLSGTVSTRSLGGLVGTNFGTIRDSTADVTVDGNVSDTGGLVGVNSGTVNTSFAVGSVEGGTTTGGLVGTDDGGTVIDSYWDVNATGQPTSADNAIGLTTDEMTGVAPLSTMGGFDLENTWQLSTGYPQLRSPGLAPVGPLAIEGVEADAEVVEGRTLAVNVTVENVGSVASDGRVTLATGGETVNQSAELTLAPGENRTVTLEWTPEDVSSGTHTLTVASTYDDNSTTVQVVGVGSVEGTVTDDVTGEPIAGATVTVGNGTYGPYDATTGADGSFALDVSAGNYDVTVESDGYHDGTTADVAVHDDGATDLGERSLSGNASISGTVEGALFGTPVDHATVIAHDLDGDVNYTTRTAADGSYTIDSVPGTGHDYIVAVLATGYEPAAYGADPNGTATLVTVGDGATVTGIDTALVGDATLDVTALDARAVDTRGVEDADVRLTRTADGASVMFENATDKNGSYSRAVPGTGADYELAFTADGYLTATDAVGNLTAGGSAAVDTRLVGNATVAGTVTDDLTGEPIADATVTVDDGNRTYRAETDANGTYAVTGVPGTGGDYEVTAEPVAGFRESGTTTASVDSNRTVTADLALERVSTYVAVDSLGSPATVEEGDGFEVTATVTNRGVAHGNATVEYVFNGTVVDSTTVSLDAGNASTVTFEYAINDAGPYEHGLRTANETVSTGINVEATPSGGGGEGDGGVIPPAEDNTDDVVETVTAEADSEGRATATVSVNVDETARVDLGDIVENGDSGTAITQVDLTFGGSVDDITFTAESLSEPPADVRTFRVGRGGAGATDGDGGDALSYFEMTTTTDGEDASERLDSATVRFTVDADRLGERGLDHEDITLHRFNEEREAWEELETDVVEMTDGQIIYSATTPGFSVFAVGGWTETGGKSDGTPTPDRFDEMPTPDDPTSTTEPAPSNSSTTDPEAGTTNGTGPGFGIIVGFIALIVVALLVRRRQRQ